MVVLNVTRLITVAKYLLGKISMAQIDPTSNGVSPFTIKVASFFLLVGLLLFPFAIAVSNFFFALLLVTVFIHPSIFQQGWLVCWRDYRYITIGILLIIGLNFIGSLWGPMDNLAFRKIGKQILWLFIPIIIGLAYYNASLRKHAFIVISLSLFIHLILTTLQYNALITIQALGSSRLDASGFIGHLSLGFIYGIWAGALIIAAQKMPKLWKFICYTLVIYTLVTVFMAHGRSGYITTIACLSLVLFKVTFPKQWKLKLMVFSIFIILISIFAFNYAPVKNKINKTIDGVSTVINGSWKTADMRLKIWIVAWEVWKNDPYFGVGTAGYPDAAKKVLQTTKVDYLQLNDAEKNIFYGHPHHEFLFALTRWGPLGLFALLFLCYHWVRTGWTTDWDQNTINAYLITASGVSVILHGLTEPSLNTHYSTLFAIVVLGFGLSKSQEKI
ncbi:MAG: O-antigen ligase family protein [Ghiorsea sp.]|nr:O-antigen ligase family protein [Ghiorsea sp.]